MGYAKRSSRMANFVVTVSYGKGVGLRKQYFVSIRNSIFAVILKSDLPTAFKNNVKPKKKTDVNG